MTINYEEISKKMSVKWSKEMDIILRAPYPPEELDIFSVFSDYNNLLYDQSY